VLCARGGGAGGCCPQASPQLHLSPQASPQLHLSPQASPQPALIVRVCALTGPEACLRIFTGWRGGAAGLNNPYRPPRHSRAADIVPYMQKLHAEGKGIHMIWHPDVQWYQNTVS
jgi:hypothetical protein